MKSKKSQKSVGSHILFMTALNVQKPCKKSPFPRNNHNLRTPRRMALLSFLQAKEITSKKTKDKNYRNRKKSESLFLELSLEGHCLDRPLWRHCGGGCLIGDCCSRLWGSDRGAATRATEEPPTSERGATGPSPRTLGPIAHSAAHHFHPRWLTLSIIFCRRWD